MDTFAPKDAKAPETDHIPLEHERAHDRRVLLKVPRPDGSEHANWALALSGGGIRSATFCLGVMQGLARGAVPSGWKAAPSKDPERTDLLPKTDGPVQHNNLLRQFDYLSTIGGGGYIGSFFVSLFAHARLNPDQTLDNAQTAEQAFKVLKADTPGSLRDDVRFEATRPGNAPLAWLREHGQFTALSGIGAFISALGLGVRNAFAVQFVLGTMLFSVFLMCALIRVVLMYLPLAQSQSWRTHEYSLLATATMESGAAWWSPIWWLTLPILTLWVVPCLIASLFIHPRKGYEIYGAPRVFGPGLLGMLLAGLVVLSVSMIGNQHLSGHWLPILQACAALGLIAFTTSAWIFVSSHNPSISTQRNSLAHSLSAGLLCLVAVVLVAALDTLAQTLFVDPNKFEQWLKPSATTAAIALVVRALASGFSEQERKGWMAKIPLDFITFVAGVGLLFLVALFWAWLVVLIRWHGAAADPTVLLYGTLEELETIMVLGTAMMLTISVATVSGQFPGFLNLSTLHAVYSSRLTRAYLAASNGHNFAPTAHGQWSSVAAAPGDNMTLEGYYANQLAPMHIISVCLHQNVDSAEQVIRRDRKGKPLAILPFGFSIDGTFYRSSSPDGSSDLSTTVTLGDWVAVSGSPFSNTIDHNSNIGFSPMMGLSNVRLGFWWNSGQGDHSGRSLPRAIRSVFKTQFYLFDELLSRFHGMRRSLHYLSDGGHLENTGLYELIRPDRKVRFVVACDCGSDPKYQFGDLANLIRLARIDFGLEVEIDSAIAADAVLGAYFGIPKEFQTDYKGGAAIGKKCALLLNVFRRDHESGNKVLHTRIVILKPRLIEGASIDLKHYGDTHKGFPQVPATDQSSAAEWESYRKLGFEIADAVFGSNEDEEYRQVLWNYILRCDTAKPDR